MTAQTALPFNDIINLIQNMPLQDAGSATKHDARSKEITQNPSDLGILNLLSRYICVSQNRYPPMVLKPEIAIFVGSQGVENTYNSTSAEKMVTLLEQLKTGNHIVNQVCNVTGCGLKTYDLNSELPTENIITESAMSEVETTQIIAYSMEAVRDSDLLIISELGAHHHIAAKSLAKALLSDDLPYSTYPLIEPCLQALDFHKINHDPLELLRRLGSREIAAMIGTIIAARYQNVPIILDGLSALVAAAIIFKINPDGINHCLVGHAYADNFHDFLANHIGLTPILNLDITLDSGIGSAMILNIIKAALSIHNYTNK
ncbi:MAG: nicotinate-nucleotide--dimethylbenzimidazole phosphoribosyltransferase [Alphaproteobacteria bacterium]|jgi:nicotinate-nucleotide--dimethylbenzimidazole phosphoribosyltransferase